FALLGGTALGRGRGEVLEPVGTHRYPRGSTSRPVESAKEAGPRPVTDTGPLWFVLVRPSFSVSTAEAYSLYRPAPTEAPSLDMFLGAMKDNDLDRLAFMMRNDLEHGVFERWPELTALRLRLLEAGALGARMTGSGSVIFGLAQD